MGMYDYFMGSCSECHEAFRVQTKLLGYCDGRSFSIGDSLGSVPPLTGFLKAKENCPRCGRPILISIQNGKVVEFLTDATKATHEEGPFGTLLDQGETFMDRWHKEMGIEPDAPNLI